MSSGCPSILHDLANKSSVRAKKVRPFRFFGSFRQIRATPAPARPPKIFAPLPPAAFTPHPLSFRATLAPLIASSPLLFCIALFAPAAFVSTLLFLLWIALSPTAALSPPPIFFFLRITLNPTAALSLSPPLFFFLRITHQPSAAISLSPPIFFFCVSHPNRPPCSRYPRRSFSFCVLHFSRPPHSLRRRSFSFCVSHRTRPPDSFDPPFQPLLPVL